MVTRARIPIFDGHNDALARMRTDGISFLNRNDGPGSACVFDLPRVLEGGLAGGIFAVYVQPRGFDARGLSGVDASTLVLASFRGQETDPPLPDLEYSRSRAIEMMADLFRLERESAGKFTVVTTAADLQRAIESGVLAAVLALEGAEPIDPELNGLEVFHRAGLRSIGIVHSRRNAFGHGVPYGLPRSPDTGPGLTDLGKDLVRACNRLGIMIDVSHLNERGFWDVAELSDAPLVATHSNAHAICPSTRNLTDDQLRVIGQSRGIAGLNYFVSFIRPDGEVDVDTPLDLMVRHIDHMVEMAGIDSVGLGSDYDYSAVPRDITSPSDLPKLVTALEDAGYRGEDLEKLLYRNWLRVLHTTWGE